MQERLDITDAKLLSRTDAAAFLTQSGFPTAPSTLAKLACIGGGPAFQKYGQRALYTRRDLLAWAQARLSAPMLSTSDAA